MDAPGETKRDTRSTTPTTGGETEYTLTALSPTARGYTSYANFLSGFNGLLSTSNRITRTESLVLTNATLGATLRRARTTVWPTDGVSTAIVVLTNEFHLTGLLKRAYGTRTYPVG